MFIGNYCAESKLGSIWWGRQAYNPHSSFGLGFVAEHVSTNDASLLALLRGLGAKNVRSEPITASFSDLANGESLDEVTNQARDQVFTMQARNLTVNFPPIWQTAWFLDGNHVIAELNLSEGPALSTWNDVAGLRAPDLSQPAIGTSGRFLREFLYIHAMPLEPRRGAPTESFDYHGQLVLTETYVAPSTRNVSGKNCVSVQTTGLTRLQDLTFNATWASQSPASQTLALSVNDDYALTSFAPSSSTMHFSLPELDLYNSSLDPNLQGLSFFLQLPGPVGVVSGQVVGFDLRFRYGGEQPDVLLNTCSATG